MGSFVRFIFVILVAGAAVNLMIVLMANAQSQRRQTAEGAVDKELFGKKIRQLTADARQQRADIAVEWQKVEAREHRGTETSLLVRQYVYSEKGDPVKLPLVRVVIPGNRVSVDALKLEFGLLFQPEREEFEVLRSVNEPVNLVYFAHIFGEDEPDKDRYLLLRPPEPPLLTRLHPKEPRPTFYEIRLWQYLWDLIPNPPVAAGGVGNMVPADPRRERAEKLGLKATWMPAATQVMQIGDTYSAFVGVDGVTLVRGTDPRLLNSMLEEAEEMKQFPNGVPVAAPGEPGDGGK